MKICKCGHTVADHRGWSGEFECRPWLTGENGVIYVGDCRCQAGDYHPDNKPAKGARL